MEQIRQPETNPVSNARRERAMPRARHKIVSKWDAHRAGQVGAEASRALTMLHESFARNRAHALSAYLRIPFETSLVSAEQCTYREHLQRLPELTYLNACKLQPADVNARLQLDLFGRLFVD